MKKLYDLAIAEGWCDLYILNGVWYGYRNQFAAMSQEVSLSAATLDSIPLNEMYLLFID